MMLPLISVAQSRFGYFSQKEVLKLLPAFESTQMAYDNLCDKCDKEFQRNEEELTRNYVSFLHDQDELPEPILRKRQKELQTLVDKSVDFRRQMKAWLAEAHDSLFSPLYAEIDDAVARVCLHNKLDYAIDLDRAGYVFINPANGYDITNAIIGTIEQTNASLKANGNAVSGNAENEVEDTSDEQAEQTEATEQSEENYSESGVQGALEEGEGN